MYVVILNFVVSIILCKYFANECKESLLSICRVQLSIMQILCKRVQREFTLNLPSAAKYFANIA